VSPTPMITVTIILFSLVAVTSIDSAESDHRE
jgi:hypothetical protein